MKIKTQRAWAGYANDGGLLDTASVEHPVFDIPVLVVPEEAVCKGKHDESQGYGWCARCGAARNGSGKWVRPRILRVGRVKK